MLALNGIYDGKFVRLLENLPENKMYRVVVTFIEELQEGDAELRNFTAQTQGLHFWNDTREDIYQDYLKGKKINK